MSSTKAPLSEDELQKFVGQNYKEVMKQLENLGYTVHLTRSGSCAFGTLPSVRLVEGQPPPPKEHRAIVNYNGDDPEQKCASIRQEYY